MSFAFSQKKKYKKEQADKTGYGQTKTVWDTRVLGVFPCLPLSYVSLIESLPKHHLATLNEFTMQ